MEIVDQYYIAVNGRKAVFNISCIPNEEDEKVALKFSNDELVMTRFPKKSSKPPFLHTHTWHLTLTPMGIQQFFDYNRPLSLEAGLICKSHIAG